jgi:N-acetylglucosamine kinase-like BadF-type ATPase
VLGADCGGTSSRVVVATLDGEIVARGRGGVGNPVVSDAHAAAGELAGAARQALAGQDPARIVAGVVGMSGSSRLADPAVAAAYHRLWTDLGVRCPIRSVGDAVVAYAAGTPEPDGAVLIAGTGAVAAAIDSWTVTRTADGFGWLLGDEGSGFWLGLAAARRTARALSRGHADSVLVRAVCDRIGSTDTDTFVAKVYALSREHVAGLAAIVVSAARAGDPEAIGILAESSDRLARTLASVEPSDGPVVLAGGLLTAVPEIRAAVQQRLAALIGRSGTLGADGALGAAWLAARTVRDDDGRGLHAAMIQVPDLLTN